jgi:hypothetical protein
MLRKCHKIVKGDIGFKQKYEGSESYYEWLAYFNTLFLLLRFFVDARANQAVWILNC